MTNTTTPAGAESHRPGSPVLLAGIAKAHEAGQLIGLYDGCEIHVHSAGCPAMLAGIAKAHEVIPDVTAATRDEVVSIVWADALAYQAGQPNARDVYERLTVFTCPCVKGLPGA